MNRSSFINHKHQGLDRKYGELHNVALSSEPKESIDVKAAALKYFNNYIARRRFLRRSRGRCNLQIGL